MTRGCSGFVLGLGVGDDWPLAQLGELGLERLEFRLRRIEAVEHLAGIVAVGELGQHVGRIRRDQIILNVRADAA